MVPAVSAVGTAVHSIFGRPMNAPSRVGNACGSVAEPDGVKRKITSHLLGCAAQVAFG